HDGRHLVADNGAVAKVVRHENLAFTVRAVVDQVVLGQAVLHFGVHDQELELTLGVAHGLRGVHHGLGRDQVGGRQGGTGVDRDVLDHVAAVIGDVVGEDAAQHCNGGVVHAASPVGC